MTLDNVKPEVFIFDTDIGVFNDSRIFDLAHARQYPGAEAIALLGDAMRARGLETVTADVYLRGALRSSPAVCLSNELTRFTRKLLGLGHVDPAACMSLESPIWALDFYSRIREASERFRHVFLWKGARERATGEAQFHEIHWPYPDLALQTGGVSWERRRFLTLINSNKRILALPKPLLQVRHPRHSMATLVEAVRQGRLRAREPWSRSELYEDRLEAIRHFALSGDFDLYGYGWADTAALPSVYAKAVGTAFCGELAPLSKVEKLSQYRFAICLENTVFPGYVTEKIFDCFVAGCIPVYLGAPDIGDYVPPAAFIDGRGFASLAHLESHLRAMTVDSANECLEAAGAFADSDAGGAFTQQRFIEDMVAVLTSGLE